MNLLIIKYLSSAFLIVLISEVAKRSDKAGALLASLPLVTMMVLFWLYYENQAEEKIANHAFYTFWYVIPTLPMFLVFPMLLRNFGFYPAIALSIVITVLCFLLLAYLLKFFSIELM